MTCDKYGQDKPSALKRMSKQGTSGPEKWPGLDVIDPVLCTACCAEARDREWMREAAAREDAELSCRK